MTVKIGINGFGRIGRNVFRAALSELKNGTPGFEIVAVNDLTDAPKLAHLLKYDSVHGIFKGDISASDNAINVGGKNIRVLSEKDPSSLPWNDMGVEIVIESTGKFTNRQDAVKHLEAGAKKVIISAPGKGEDITIVMGVNDDKYNPLEHHIISCASCTTNCLAPIAMVLHRNYGLLRGMITTIHSYTNDQQILDLHHNDLRRARAAALSIIPTTTGAAKAVSLVLPELKGRMNGLAMRVPTPNVSVTDLIAELKKPVTKEEVNNTLKEASSTYLKGIMDYSELPLVSRDYNGNPNSAIIDALSTMVIESMVKVVAWYDNEWGYSNRVIDTTKMLIKKGLS